MFIRLDVDYVNDYVFWPVYRMDGTLLAAIMITRFNRSSGNMTIMPDIIFSLLTKKQRHDLIKDKVEFIKRNADWFSRHGVSPVLKIDYEMADFIMRSRVLCNEIKNLPCIQLEIDERFPNLSLGKKNDRILKLSKFFNLWLDDFASGKVNLTPLNHGFINTVRMDQKLVWRLLSRVGNTSMMDPLLQVLKEHYQGITIIAKGIDTTEYLDKARQSGIDAVQGSLWPAVHFGELKIKGDFFIE